MKNYFIVCLLAVGALASCKNEDSCKDSNCAKEKTEKLPTNNKNMENKEITAKNTDQEISCKLTSPELQKRKETVIANLKKQILEKKELSNGFAYRFEGTDEVIDELAEFIKSERSCCSFFTFGLSFSGDGSEAWLNLTGPEGAKEMITNEIGL